MLDKIKVNRLLDFYMVLLTQKQQEIMTCYYREDYSLQEIGELYGISRSAAHDLIRRCEQNLVEYEDKLHLAAGYDRRCSYYDQIKLIAQNKEVDRLIDQCLDTEV